MVVSIVPEEFPPLGGGGGGSTPSISPESLERRKNLAKDLKSIYEHADKAILTLSSAGLGLSIEFLSKVQSAGAAAPARVVSFLLVPSWVCFFVAILSTVLSMKVSIVAHQLAIEKIEAAAMGRQPDSGPSRAAQWTGRLNNISLGAFVVGALLTTLFVSTVAISS